MGIVIGIDEAGLGPNLGPLVITATVWDVPDPMDEFCFWEALAEIVSCDPSSNDHRCVIADSKSLFQPHKPLTRLEHGLWPALIGLGVSCESLRSFDAAINVTFGFENCAWLHAPWLHQRDLSLPTTDPHEHLTRQQLAWQECRPRLQRVASRIVHPAEFNRLLTRGNKAEVVTQCHLELLREVLSEYDGRPCLVFSDKHGGRNRYAAALSNTWEGDWVETLSESSLQSVYRIGGIQFHFEPRAEQHLPVAFASMVCKYLRELHMRMFNSYWQSLVPGLPPTQGYPVDAHRFYAAIEKKRAKAGLSRDMIWRNR